MLVMPVDNALTGLAPPLTFNDTLSHAYVAVNANSALAVYLEPQALQAGWSLQVRVRAQRTLRFCARSSTVCRAPAERCWTVCLYH